MDTHGNYNVRAPHEVMQHITDLHAMCSHKQNLIIAWGFARGARWLDLIVREYLVYLHVAFIIAGSPESRCEIENSHAAKELIEVARKTDTIVVLVLLCSVGEIEWALFGALLLNGFGFKVLVAALDTPLVYLGAGWFRRRFGLEPGQEIAL